MTTIEEICGHINGLSPEAVSGVVRKALGDDSAEVVAEWEAVPMPVDSIGTGTTGFATVRGSATVGSGRDEAQWSVVVKALDASTDKGVHGGDGSFNTPAREIGAYRSGFFDLLSDGLKAAPCHGITEFGGVVLLWLEDFSDAVETPWNRDQFLSTARLVGQFNGGWPEERAPDGDWLDRELATNHPLAMIKMPWIGELEVARDSAEMAELQSLSGWQGLTEIHREYAEIARSLVGMPRVISHNDIHSRNAFIREHADGTSTTYAIDWASVGLGPVGVDPGMLAGGALIRTDQETKLISEIEPELFEQYLDGLRDAGYGFDLEQVRLGYLSDFMSVLPACTLGVLQIPQNGLFARVLALRVGVTGDELKVNLAGRLRTFKPLFDEALTLARGE